MAAFRLKVESGSLSVGLGLIGVGAFAVTPTEYASYIAWAFILAGLLALIWDVRFERGHFATEPIGSLSQRLKLMGPQILMFAGGAIFLVGLVWQVQRSFATRNADIPASTPEIAQHAPAPSPIPAHSPVPNPFAALNADELAVRQGIW